MKNVNDIFYHNLQDWEEVAGKLQRFEESKGIISLQFSNGINIKTFETNKDIIKKLKGSLGKTVNILKTDIPRKRHCITIIENKDKSRKTFRKEIKPKIKGIRM